MKYLLVSSFFGFMLLYAFEGYFDKKNPVVQYFPKEKQIVLNPLDTILGEKKLDDGSLRKDNFRSILQIKASFLKDLSELYHIREITKDLFLLTRKKFYYDNRSYSLFVKTKGNKIVFYQAISDFMVRSAIYSDQRIFFISDDYSEIASPWRPTYTVRIICCDLKFHQVWQTASIPNKGYFFYGEKIIMKNDQLVVRIGIQNEGSSTMCVDNLDLTLTKSGKIMQSFYISGYGCGGKSASEAADLSNLFENN